MQINEKCQKCPNLQAVLDRPTPDTETRIGKIYGVDVDKVLTRRDTASGKPPIEMWLINSTRVPKKVVDEVYVASKADEKDKTDCAERLMSGCPGLLEGHVELESQQLIIPVCGKVAVEAAELQALAQMPASS